MLIMYSPYIEGLSQNSDKCDQRGIRRSWIGSEPEQPRVAICFALRFMIDVSASFNREIAVRPEAVDHISPPAILTSYAALDIILSRPELVSDPRRAFKDIYETLKTISRKWKLAGKCDSFSAIVMVHVLTKLIRAHDFAVT
jgi:hypothetical protein